MSENTALYKSARTFLTENIGIESEELAHYGATVISLIASNIPSTGNPAIDAVEGMSLVHAYLKGEADTGHLLAIELLAALDAHQGDEDANAAHRAEFAAETARISAARLRKLYPGASDDAIGYGASIQTSLVMARVDNPESDLTTEEQARLFYEHMRAARHPAAVELRRHMQHTEDDPEESQ